MAQGTIEYTQTTSGTIHLDCYADQIILKNSGNGVEVFLENGTRLLRKSHPDLPKMTATMIIDDHAKMQVNIIHESYEDFENVNVVPSKGNLIRNIDPSSVPFTYSEAYTSDDFYPGTLAELSDPFIEGQYRGQSLQFYPVQYNAVTKVLRVYHHIEAEIVITDEVGLNPLSDVPQGINRLMDEVYDNRFINYSENSDRYSPIPEIGNMLVISPAQYFDELQPWIQWKKEKGIHVTLVDVATINSTSAINSYVENFYLTNGLTFLQLVGDESQVPSYLVNNSGGQGYCDVCYGYISGNDHYSEIFVGRFLVHNGNELVPVISKVLEYEKNPYTATDWFSVAMGIASNEGTGYGDDGEADWQHSNHIKSDLLGFTYEQVWEKYDGSHASSSPTGGTTADGSSSPSASSLSQVINNGCSLINYTGHGDHAVIVTGNYTNTTINALSNHHKYPYFIIVGCCVGDFDDDSGGGDTFGEAWLKSPNAATPTGGIGGSFSSVFQSWAPPMEGQDEMNELIAGMGSYSTRHTLGSIHYFGCASMNDAYGGDGNDMTDTWIVMGDPSIQLRTAFPTQITATHPIEEYFGVTSLAVSSPSEGALVSLTWQGEIIATGLIQGGVCTLSFVPQNNPGNLLLTLTNFNTIPYQATISLLPFTGAYVVENEIDLSDLAGGNNNGEADYSEEVDVSIELENIGGLMAVNVVGVLTTADPYVTIVNGTHQFGNINAASILTENHSFQFSVNNTIPDQHIAEFTVTYTDNSGSTWTTSFEVTLNAPVLSCSGDYTIDDGNDNGRLDSGETATMTIALINTGHAVTKVNAISTLTEISPYVSISGSPDNTGIIGAGNTVQATFTLHISADAPVSEPVDFDLHLTTDYYGTECSFGEVLNRIVEDWETGDASQFDWQLEGEEDWFVTENSPFEGNYCMQSGDISHEESTTLKIVADFIEPGTVSFARKVSSEGSYDILRFRINGVTSDTWSGEQGWEVFSYPVNAGSQTLRWVYSKDDLASFGSDAAWVDDIVLPPFNFVSVTEERSEKMALDIFPNPVAEETWIRLTLEEPTEVTVELLDYTGRKLLMERRGILSTGHQRIKLDTSGLASGVYFVQIISDKGIVSKEIIKQ